MSEEYSEDSLVEQPAIELMKKLGWSHANCYHETFGEGSALGRETSAEVVLVSRLRDALERLNPTLPTDAIDQSIAELTRDRGTMGLAQANREIYKLLKNGVRVTVRRNNEEAVELARVIDWDNAEKNDFFVASQYWVTGELYKRRADLVGFVNGLPLVFVELKAAHRRLEHAYQHNLTDYKATIPHLFLYNAFIVLSNGSQSRVGSVTSEWEHFTEWKKVNSEGEKGVVSLDTMLRGTCEPKRLLDLVENFILFSEGRGGLIKLVAKNHQYLGVNNAIIAVGKTRQNKGRLGVFWHTQGSGKSYSMVFFAQKILRKMPGNWTFLVVTDRNDLDTQIYKNFANTGSVTEPEDRVRAQGGDHLKQLLQEDHRYVFTLIQKFHVEKGKKYPKLSDRSDVIVMTDEAHRSQYDILALNMRNALPSAAFIGFTGTPLMSGEEKTREVFGDYVSIYNFKQSVDDQATVPLYYENRIPELQLTNERLNEDMADVLERAELDEEQERKLEREFSREYHLITRDDRLDRTAEDLVTHFLGRGQQGKAMVISIDKLTAARMYAKVQHYWKKHHAKLKAQLKSAEGDAKRQLQAKIKYMEETDMAVVVSQSQNELEFFKKRGVDFAPHRRRMVKEDLETKFKDPENPLRIVFVCAMWITGFDVPSCSTIYLDKPMRNHTLMQTIARANRVFHDKVNGLIVDYVGVFRNLQKALAIYGSEAGGGIKEGDTPVREKAALVELLKKAIEDTTSICAKQGIKIDNIEMAEGFERVKLLDDAVDALLASEEIKKRFLSQAALVNKLYKAILPDPAANEHGPNRTLFATIAEKIRATLPPVDISHVTEAVEEVLDESIAAQGYIIHAAEGPAPYGSKHLIDLSKIDFEALKAKFAKSRKHIELEKLKTTISIKLSELLRLNKSRMNFLERFHQLIEEYNRGAANVDTFFKQLVAFAQELNDEEKRAIGADLSEEELTIFDLLTKPNIKLTTKDEKQVKKVAKELLGKLKKGKLVLDWRKRQQSRANVRLCVEETLEELPGTYTKDLYQRKCELIFQHIFDAYADAQKNLYGEVG